MKDVKLTNIPSMNIGRIVDDLTNVYSTVIKQKMPVKSVPSVMLWGAPGVGKSQAIRQLAKGIEENTGKKVVVTDVRLLLFNPIDLRGIPTANADKTLAVWLKPQIFQMNDSDKYINILFLDELSAAPQSVQAAAYQITLDRVVGEHKLPDNCIVIAAGNRTTDKSVAFKMPKALANRVLHIEVEGSFDSWKEWAVRSGINSNVFGFRSFRLDYLMGFDAANEDLAFATPRSWEMVSNLLNTVSDDVGKMYNLIAGLVGSGNQLTCSLLRAFHQSQSAAGIIGNIDTLIHRAGNAMSVQIQTDLRIRIDLVLLFQLNILGQIVVTTGQRQSCILQQAGPLHIFLTMGTEGYFGLIFTVATDYKDVGDLTGLVFNHHNLVAHLQFGHFTGFRCTG